jgi:hypothetical protein
MAERIEALTRRSSPGRPPIYPWSTWMDGSCWRLTSGEDFHIAPTHMGIAIRQYAQRHGVAVDVAVNNELETVELQFHIDEDVAA